MVDFYITAVSGGDRLELSTGKSRILVGRHPDCDIVLTEGHPSRKHASLTAREDGVWLEDLGSANGTFVNGSRIEAGVLLKAGDRVNFDTAIFEIGSHGAFEDSAQLKADLDATVLRSEVGAAEKETHSSEAVPSHASGAKAPASWADPEYQSGEGTMLMGADGLKEMQADLDAPQELESVDEPCLTVLSGNCKGKSFRLTGDQQILQWEIGSEGSRDIVIDDEGISAFHAKLVNEGDRWKLIDQMSANGTWVNQKKCNISYLRSGDRIRFALVECQVALPGADGIIDSAPAPISGKRFPWVTAGIAFVITLAAVYLLMQWF